MDKSIISLVCENVLKQALFENPQVSNNKINWVLNGSTICNVLPNVIKINDIDVSEEFNTILREFVRQPK